MTTITGVTAPKEVVPPRLVGKALYLELEMNPEIPEDKRYRISWEHAHNPTKQLIIYPSWIDDSGKSHRGIAMERIVSSTTPRAQWDFSSKISPITTPTKDESSHAYYADKYLDYKEIPRAEQGVMPESDLRQATITHAEILVKKATQVVFFGEDDSQYVQQGWIVRGNKPIAVEVTDEDLKLVLERKTPQAVIRRINKVRATLDNFPEKLG
jgi:hypothetical protein